MKSAAALFVLLCLVFASESLAQCQNGACSTSQSYAAQMNARGFFRHDRNWGGAEVIYKTTGNATEADARNWWMKSPPHRRLLLSGAIQDVACVGGVCVGRSVSAINNNLVQPAKQGFAAGAKFTNRIKFKLRRCR